MKGKEKYITYSKALAAIIVIVWHAWGNLNISSTFMHRLMLLFYITHVPTFMLISGMLYTKHTVKHDYKYRIIKVANLGLCCLLYVLILTVLRTITNLVLGIRIDLQHNLMASVHNMWYFPVLCVSIIVYEIIIRINKQWMIYGLLILVVCDIILLYKNPSIGKMLVYVLIFLGGGSLEFSRRRASVFLLLNMALWAIVVFILNQVDVRSEGSSGTELLLMMIMTVCGSFIIPSVMYLICNQEKKKETNAFISGICNNTQLIYFFQFIPIVIVAAFNKAGIISYSAAICLILSFVYFVFSYLMSSFVSNNSILKRIFLKPIN